MVLSHFVRGFWWVGVGLLGLAAGEVPQEEREAIKELAGESLILLQAKDSGKYVTAVENYLNNLTTISGSFVQKNTTAEGGTSTLKGSLFWWKSPKARREAQLQMDLPDIQRRYIVKEGMMYILDLSKRKTAPYNLAGTPLAFLFKRSIRLKEQFPLAEVALDPNRNMLVLMLRRKKGGGVPFTLFFSLYKNGNLRSFEGWLMKDSKGTLVSIQAVPGTLRFGEALSIQKKHLFDPGYYEPLQPERGEGDGQKTPKEKVH